MAPVVQVILGILVAAGSLACFAAVQLMLHDKYNQYRGALKITSIIGAAAAMICGRILWGAPRLMSYLLLLGLVVGVVALVQLTLARYVPRRRLLGVLTILGWAAFIWTLMALSAAGTRLYVFYFWLFAAAIIGGAIGTVTMRNVFHAALSLILSLVGVAGFFILTNAEFLAMVQVIIYIGGIMVLFLFGIMVSQNIIGVQLKQDTPHAPWSAVFSAILFLFMFFAGLTMTFPPPISVPIGLENNTQAIGWSLMATFSLPFEVASVLLLMSMLGAIILVRKD